MIQLATFQVHYTSPCVACYSVSHRHPLLYIVCARFLTSLKTSPPEKRGPTRFRGTQRRGLDPVNVDSRLEEPLSSRKPRISTSIRRAAARRGPRNFNALSLNHMLFVHQMDYFLLLLSRCVVPTSEIIHMILFFKSSCGCHVSEINSD